MQDEEDHYVVYEVNNYWDDLQKFGAISARFLGKQHGVTFQIVFHTEGSWHASVAHAEYLCRKFDTVIKTDTIFCDDPRKLEEAHVQMRREDMWKERCARITVPDRALTVGTRRCAHTAPRRLPPPLSAAAHVS
jgi:hypothetical protein